MKLVFKNYVRLMMLVLPVSFLPLVIDSFGLGRNWILMTGAILGLLLWAISLWQDFEKKVNLNNIWLLMGLLVVFGWLQWWFLLTPGVRMRGLVDFGGIGTLTAWWVWLFLWTQTSDDRKVQLNILTVAGIVVGILSMGLFLYPEAKLPIIWPSLNPVFSIYPNWSMTGSLLNEMILMTFLVVDWLKKVFFKLKDNQNYVMDAVVVAFLSLFLAISIFRAIKTGSLNYMDGVTSWVIMVETFKKMPVWGVGGGNFVEAFFAFRPASYNLTQYWESWFKYSSMGILHLWTEMGTVGLGLVVLMANRVWKVRKNFEGIRLVLWGLLIALTPYYFMGVWLMMWMLAGVEGRVVKIDLAMFVEDKKINVGGVLVIMAILGVSLSGGYWMYKILVGEHYMRQSVVASSNYDLQLKAVNTLPLMAEYHKTISQTIFLMAGGVLSNKELSESDKQQASDLISLSVTEAKRAIDLDKNNPTYWLNLATIYKQLIGLVNGAPDWSFQAYEQAVVMEPVNAASRLELGGLLYAAGRYDEADRVFEVVLLNKVNYANGWYNWAHSAKQLKKLPEAIARLTQALALVPVNSGDFEIANKELIEWKNELGEINKKQAELLKSETLTNPEALPTKVNNSVAVPTGGMEPTNLLSTT